MHPGLQQIRNGNLYKAALSAAVDRVRSYVIIECKRQHKESVGTSLCAALSQITRKCSRHNESKLGPTAQFLLASWAYQVDREGGLEGALDTNLMPDSERDEKQPRKQEVIASFMEGFQHFVKDVSGQECSDGAQAFRRRLQKGLLHLASSRRTKEVCCQPSCQRYVHTRVYFVPLGEN